AASERQTLPAECLDHTPYRSRGAPDEQPSACLRIGDQLALPPTRPAGHLHLRTITLPVPLERPGRRAPAHPYQRCRADRTTATSAESARVTHYACRSR